MSNNWSVDDVEWTPPTTSSVESTDNSQASFSDDDFGGIDNSEPDSTQTQSPSEEPSSSIINSANEDDVLKEIEEFGDTSLDYIVRGKSKTKSKKRSLRKPKDEEIIEVSDLEVNNSEVISDNQDLTSLDSLFSTNEQISPVAELEIKSSEIASNLGGTLQEEKKPNIDTSINSEENGNPKEADVNLEAIFPKDFDQNVSIDSLFSSNDEDFTSQTPASSDLGNIFINNNTASAFAEDRSSKFTSWDIERKAHEFNRLWPTVEILTRASQSDIEIQKIVPDMLLTRDLIIDSLQKKQLQDLLRFKIGAAGISIPNPDDSTPILDIAYDEMLGISVLGDLWRDNDITEIMVDRWDRITIEKNGKLEITPITFRSQQHAESVARNLALRISDRALSSSIPLVTAELPDARITFAFGSVVKGRISITLRKFRALLNLDELLKRKSLNNEMVSFLKDAVASRAGILVSGGTGTGKTTIINLLSTFIPVNERVITIEDAFELNIAAEHVVSLQTKEASSRDDQISITLADLMRNTLRMRPDRIIVGEIREGEGASVMLAAANTGHDGTMTTIHASSAELALNERLVDLVRDVRSSSDEAIKRTIISAFEIVVQVSRGRKGQRFLSEIAVVDSTSLQNGNIKPTAIFVGEEQTDGTVTHRKVGKIPSGSTLQLKMSLAGVPEDRW